MSERLPNTKYVWVRTELEGGDVPFIQTDGNLRPFERTRWLAPDVDGVPGEWTKESIPLGDLYPYRPSWRWLIADAWYRLRLWVQDRLP